MEQFFEFFENLFTTSLWPKRWACGKWTDFHGWLYIISSIAIWMAYFSIPVLLYRVIDRRRSDLPFVKVFWLFILFIFACGTTHFLDAFMFYVPVYRVSAVVLFGTAIISWIAFFGLKKVLPVALTMKTPQQYQVVIDSQTNELKTQYSELKSLNEDLDSFVYAASHDLKSPVNNLEGLLSILQKSDQSESNRELMSHMESSISRMKSTLQNLSDVIKVQKTPFASDEKIEIDELIDDILVDNKILLDEAGAVIEKDLKVKTVKWSRIVLKSVVYNLLSNAAKYRDPERPLKITITSQRGENGTELHISDTGLGFDSEKKGEKVFDLFTRFHAHVEGAGIGLYMVKNMVTKKGGNLVIKSKVGEGTTASVYLNELKR